MKKILLSAAALLMIVGVNAQSWGFGPKVGANFATVNGIEGAKVRSGVTAGVFMDFMINDWFAIESDLLYTMNGFRINQDNYTTKVHLDFINMPIVTKYYVTGGLNLQLGAQFGYLVTSKVLDGGSWEALEKMANKYNVDIVAGIAYDFDFGLILEGRYNIGTTKLFNNTADAGVTNGALQFSAAWRF